MTNRKSTGHVFDVAIVGGGASGCAAAYYLSRVGARVVLLERYDLNTEASGRNAGSLHGQIQHEPFLEKGEEWARSWLPALRFLADSLAVWDGLGEEVGVDLQVVKQGGLLIADHPDQMPAIEQKVALENSIGIPSRVLTATELRELAPWVMDDSVGGQLCPIEGKANPLLVTPAFARRAVEHGAVMSVNTPVERFSETGGIHTLHTPKDEYRAHRVLLTGGDGMVALGQHFGLELPITSEAIQVSVTERVAPTIKHLVYFAGGKLTLKQAQSGTLLIGGGWPARRNTAGEWIVNPESLRSNVAIATRVAPVISDVKLLRTWVGVGNGTPDHRPLIGAVPGHPSVILGFYPYMGFTASPLMGQVLTSLVLGHDPGRDLAPFAPDRF